jgi:hypothetical protein
MTITNDYLIVEKLKTLLVTACPSARVFDSTPTVLTQHELESLFRVTFEQAHILYAWMIASNGIAVQPHGTMSQREANGLALYGYVIHADRPGLPDADDPGISNPFASGTATATGSTTSLTDSSAAMTVNGYSNTHELWVTHADGSLDHARILSNTATIFTLRPPGLHAAVALGDTYQVFLRPTEIIAHEEARAVLDTLTTNRSNLASAITGTLGGYRMESVLWYGLGMWRATFEFNRDLFPSKSFA